MRQAFLSALLTAAEADERIWLLCGDLGYSVLEPFAARFPDRFLNCGVAEQTMIGVAAGLARDGRIPFVYSIANFASLRCAEQIRNDVAYHGLPVKIVSVGAGFAYGTAGFTHFGLEEVALLRTFPNMVVVAPGDPWETSAAVIALARDPRPAYLRLGKGREPRVHAGPPDFALGRAIVVRAGRDLTILAAGGLLAVAAEAVETLAASGLAVELVSMPSIVPLDETALADAAQRTGKLLTVEEHGPGGLGSAVAEWIAERGLAVRLKRLHVGRERPVAAGSQDYLRRQFGLSADSIVEAARELTAPPPG